MGQRRHSLERVGPRGIEDTRDEVCLESRMEEKREVVGVERLVAPLSAVSVLPDEVEGLAQIVGLEIGQSGTLV